MKELKRFVAVVLMGMIISVGTAGTLAQKGGNDNRPPKEPEKVKEPPKPPPSNSNQSNSNKKKP